MERTVKTSTAIRPRQGQDVFLFPGASEAEPWGIWIAAGKGESQFAQTCATPRENPWQKRSTLVLPVSQVFCLPLWLNESQTDLLPAMIDLQLESRGLAGRGERPAIYQWSVVVREGGRTLVLVGLLPAELPAQFRVGTYKTFDVSPRYFSWPENALTLWLEQGKLAVAITRGTQLAYFQNLGEARCTTRVLQALISLRAGLELQEILSPLSQVVLRTDATSEEEAALGAALRLPTRQVDAQIPITPAIAWNLSPHEVVRSKQMDDSRRWKWRALLIAFALYLVIATFLIGQLLLTNHRVAVLRQWQSQNAGALASVQKAKDDWQRLQPVVDTANYPLEVLLHCAEAIPKSQLHLTLFEFDHDHLTLKGEATNVGAAYTLYDKLKSERGLSAYTWTMGEPHLLPNDLAQLEIEGNHANPNF